MSIDANQFKSALKLWASGVTVVTAHSAEQGAKGMTVTAFSSVSMDPPQVLVCLNQSTDTGALVLEQGRFAVNILTTEQQDVSNQFAGGSSQVQRFAAVSWQLGELATPVLNDCLASLECEVIQHVLAGSHWVIIGEVKNVVCREGAPVLYYHGGYQQLA